VEGPLVIRVWQGRIVRLVAVLGDQGQVFDDLGGLAGQLLRLQRRALGDQPALRPLPIGRRGGVRQSVQPGHDHPRLLGGDMSVALSDSDHREHVPHGVGVGVDRLGDVRVQPVAVPQQRPRRPGTQLCRQATVVDVPDDRREQPVRPVDQLPGRIRRRQQLLAATPLRR